jgi:hypothetical protein
MVKAVFRHKHAAYIHGIRFKDLYYQGRKYAHTMARTSEQSNRYFRAELIKPSFLFRTYLGRTDRV